MLGQYQEFAYLAAVNCRKATWHGYYKAMQAFYRDFGPFIQQGLAELIKVCAGCLYCWLPGPIHPKYILWSCSLAILQVAPSWWRCPAEGNQVLPEQGDVWRYRTGSGSYPWMLAGKGHLGVWQNAPVDLITEVSVGEHKRRFGTTVKTYRDVYRTTIRVDPISLAPLLEALTR